MEGVSKRSSPQSADQSRGRRGWLVGRRSSVSSSSASCASCAIDHPSARAIRLTVPQAGFCLPDSMCEIQEGSTPASSATVCCSSPSSSRRRRIARPSASCGSGLAGMRVEPSLMPANPGCIISQVMERPERVVIHASAASRAIACRYSISRSRSAGVVPRARASRRSMLVVGSRRAFSILLMCERLTPLRRDRTTCEIPAASRAARRLAAS